MPIIKASTFTKLEDSLALIDNYASFESCFRLDKFFDVFKIIRVDQPLCEEEISYLKKIKKMKSSHVTKAKKFLTSINDVVELILNTDKTIFDKAYNDFLRSNQYKNDIKLAVRSQVEKDGGIQNFIKEYPKQVKTNLESVQKEFGKQVNSILSSGKFPNSQASLVSNDTKYESGSNIFIGGLVLIATGAAIAAAAIVVPGVAPFALAVALGLAAVVALLGVWVALGGYFDMELAEHVEQRSVKRGF